MRNGTRTRVILFIISIILAVIGASYSIQTSQDDRARHQEFQTVVLHDLRVLFDNQNGTIVRHDFITNYSQLINKNNSKSN